MPYRNEGGYLDHLALCGSAVGVAVLGWVSDHMTLQDEGWDRRQGLEQPYRFPQWSLASSFEP